MATWEMISFQDSNSPYMDNLISFHNLIMMIMLMIITLILFILKDLIYNSFSNRFLLKNHNIEIIWTIVPILILIFICFPSLKTLYFIDEVLNPYFSIKAIGHQWYWSYEYPEFNNLNFDSYMLNNLTTNQFRLIDVDHRLVIPNKIPLRLITSSSDVIHSWTIPAMGVKVDSIPGRLNQTNLFSLRPGIFFGQCSEICGANHSFMPICLESTLYKYFTSWIKNIN